MATLEERMTTVEGAVARHDNLIERLVRLEEKQAIQQDALSLLLANHEERLEQAKRDSAKTQRLWVRLCQKNGWLDDLDEGDEA